MAAVVLCKARSQLFCLYTDGRIERWCFSAESEMPSFVQTAAWRSEPATACALDPDGNVLVVGGRLGVVRCFDAASGAEISRHIGHEGAIRFAQVASNHVVTVSESGEIRLLPIASERLKARLKLARDPGDSVAPMLRSLSFGNDGEVAGCSNHGEIVVWRTSDWTPIGRTAFLTPAVVLRHSPDGHSLAVGGTDGVVRLLAAKTRAEVAAFGPHSSTVSELAWSSDGRHLLVFAIDRSFTLWTTSDRRIVSKGQLQPTEFDHPNRVMVEYDSRRGQFLFSPTNGSEVLFGPEQAPRTGTYEMGLLARSVHTGARLVLRTSLSAGLFKMAHGCEPPQALVLITSAGEFELERHSLCVTAAFSANGAMLATADSVGGLQIRHAGNGVLRAGARFGGADSKRPQSITFSPDNRWLAVEQRGAFEILDIHDVDLSDDQLLSRLLSLMAGEGGRLRPSEQRDLLLCEHANSEGSFGAALQQKWPLRDEIAGDPPAGFHRSVLPSFAGY